MQTNTATFDKANQSQSQELRLCIRLDFSTDGSDYHYFTSHSDIPTPSPANTTHGVLLNTSSSSQKLVPERANSSIGNLSFELLDADDVVSTLFNTKSVNRKLLFGKEAQLRVGYKYPGMIWSDYKPAATQYIDNKVQYRQGVYYLSCKDGQAKMARQIMEPLVTRLDTTITATATTLSVYDTTNWQLVERGADFTDSPSSTVTYCEISDGTYKEYCRITAIATGQFTVVRGVLGSTARAWTVPVDATDEKGPKVKELIFLHDDSLEATLATLTGDQPGLTGKLPPHWHLGMDASLFNAAEFTAQEASTAYGFDLKKTDGKKFIEEELLLANSNYLLLDGEGNFKLKKIYPIGNNAATVATLDETNIVEHDDISFDINDLYNNFKINWSFDALAKKQEYRRPTSFTFQDSIDDYKIEKTKVFNFRLLNGVAGSTKTTILNIVNAFASRFAGEAARTTVKCLPTMNDLEVGDVIRLKHPNIKDFNAGGSVDRSMQIISKKVDQKAGMLEFELYGSTYDAAPIADSQVNVLDDAFYNTGTQIPNIVAGVLTADTHLTGHATDHNLAIWKHTGDFSIPPGVTLTWDKNVQVRHNGHVSVTTGIGQTGGGKTAVDGGLIGPSIGRPGEYVKARNGEDFYSTVVKGEINSGEHVECPSFDLINNSGTSIDGVPANLLSCAGAAGGDSTYEDVGIPLIETSLGGAAGNASGSAMVWISRGGFSLSGAGAINVSGEEGAVATPSLPGGKTLGGQAGHAIASPFVVLLDGGLASVPNFKNRVTALSNNGEDLKHRVAKYQFIPQARTAVEDETVEEAATGNVTITQATEPTDSDCFTLYGRNLIVGDIWEDSDDGNKRYRYDGADFVYQKNYSSWPEVQDTAGTKPADNATATGIDNLILNGDLELENNTNWGGEQYRAGGFSSWAKQGHIETDALANVVDKYIPVDTNDAYEIEAVVGAEQAGSTGYVGVQCYDENKVLIKAWESYFLANTNTTIFEAASAGATSIKIVPPATSWNPVDIYYYAHLDAAVDGSHLPSRSTVNLTQNGVVDNTTFHTVSLAEPLPEAVSVGQVVALSRSVSNYPYIYSNQPISQQTLTRHSGVLIGENGINEVLPNTKFRAGTKFVKPFVYLNRTVAGTSRVTKLSIRKLGAKLSGIEDGATLGADWGANTANRPVNLRDLTGLEAILNGDITISVDGQLLGGGGGQVTINGLGYTGALNANYITNTSELTDGAQLGLTSLWAGVPDRPANLAALGGTEPILNTLVDKAWVGLGSVVDGADITSLNTALNTANVGGLTQAQATDYLDRASAGLNAFGDVARQVPDARINSSGVTQHQAAIVAGNTSNVGTVPATDIDDKHTKWLANRETGWITFLVAEQLTWFRVATITGQSGRGHYTFKASATGGGASPATVEFIVSINWGSSATVKINGSHSALFFTDMRITYDSVTGTSYFDLKVRPLGASGFSIATEFKPDTSWGGTKTLLQTKNAGAAIGVTILSAVISGVVEGTFLTEGNAYRISSGKTYVNGIPALEIDGKVAQVVPDSKIASTSVIQHETLVNALNLVNAPAEAGANVTETRIALNALNVGIHPVADAEAFLTSSGLGFNPDGTIKQAVPLAIANASDLLRYSGGAEYSGSLKATAGQVMNAGSAMDSLDKWYGTNSAQYAGGLSGDYSVVTITDGITGDKCIQVSDNSDDSDDIFSELMPIDPNKTYKISVIVRQPSGDRRNYLLVDFRDGNGTRIGGTGSDGNGWLAKGSYHYWGVSNSPFPATFTRYTLALGAQGDATMPSSARFLTFGGLLCRDGAVGTSTTIQMQDFKLEEIVGDYYQTILSAGKLKSNTAIAQSEGSTTYRTAARGLDAGTAEDGVAINLAQAWDGGYEVVFLGGGLINTSTLTGDYGLVTDVLAKTSSGFTPSLKLRETAGTITPVTRTTIVTGGGANPDYMIDKATATEAWDDTYNFQFDVTINNTYDFELGGYLGGSVTVELYAALTSGNWVQYGTPKTFNGNDGEASTTLLNEVMSFVLDALGNHAGYEFGISIGSGTGSISVDHVTFGTATAPGETSATPAGVSNVKYKLIGGT